MAESRDDEYAWLRFSFGGCERRCAYAKVPETAAILRELITEVEARLEQIGDNR
jgi:hypothetical protein